MNITELWFRRNVIWCAKRVPVESPGWATLGIILPNFVSYILVRGTIQEAGRNFVISAFLSNRQLFWIEVSIQLIMALVGFSFLCRLLQICDLKYFDQYKVEESR